MTKLTIADPTAETTKVFYAVNAATILSRANSGALQTIYVSQR
jgi:hypothetical protein